MNVPTGLAVALLLITVAGTGFALKCLECIDTPRPDVCDTVTNCVGNNTSCFLRQYITSSGSILYETGCKSKYACAIPHTRDLQNDDADDSPHDVEVCRTCCDNSNYCNIEGCGSKVADISQRGLYCYECSVENNVYGCRTVRQCAAGDVCSIQKAPFPDMYTSGCVREHVCSHMHTNPIHLMGRDTSGLTIHIPYCCKTDFCNDILHFVANSSSVVDGGWSHWNEWSGCTKTCGSNAVQSRHRTCDNPTPQHHGRTCTGDSDETTNCMLQDCPVDGGWSHWNTWSGCTETCGAHAVQTRNRTCDNPTPHHHGRTCAGVSVETNNCTLQDCPVDGTWSSWTSWSTCTKSCGPGGHHYRTRKCNNPAPLNNGTFCSGQNNETETCTGKSCLEAKCRHDKGFEIVRGLGETMCLRFSTHHHSWEDSRRRCKDEGGDLVIVSNSNMDYMLQNYILSKVKKLHLHDDDKYAWIGLSVSDHSWQWVNHTVTYGYNRFSDSEEQEKDCHHHHCAVAGGAMNEHWWAKRCDKDYHYICAIDVSH